MNKESTELKEYKITISLIFGGQQSNR